MAKDFDTGDYNPTWEQMQEFDYPGWKYDQLIKGSADTKPDILSAVDSAISDTASYVSKIPKMAWEDFKSSFDTGGTVKPKADPTSLGIERADVKEPKIHSGVEGLTASGIDSGTGEPSWWDGLSNSEKFKMVSLGSEALGDIVSYGPKMTAAIGDIQARGALGMAPGSAIDPIKEVGPSSFAPDVAEIFAARDKKEERKDLMKELGKIVHGGEDDVPEYGGVDDIINAMGPLKGIDSSGLETKHKKMKIIKPPGSGGGDGALSAASGDGGAGMGGGTGPAIKMHAGIGGSDDVWNQQTAVDIANRAIASEEGGNGDIQDGISEERKQELLMGMPAESFNEQAWLHEQEDKQLAPIGKEYATTSEPESLEGYPMGTPVELKQIDVEGEFVKSEEENKEYNSNAIKAGKVPRAVTGIGEQLQDKAGIQDSDIKPNIHQEGTSTKSSDQSPSDTLSKIAATMSISDKLDFLDDKKENKKVKELEQQMQALQQQQQADEDVEWLKLQQEKLKSTQNFTPTPITQIRWR
jgi:hypothetical protein